MKRRGRQGKSYLVPALVLAVFALVLAARFVPSDFPVRLLTGATGVLSVNVCNETDEGLDCGTPPPPPPATTTPPGGGGGGGSRSGFGGGGGGGSYTIVPQAPAGSCIGRQDVNHDSRIDLADFSILAYWFKRPLTPAAAAEIDLNCDGKVDLVDFSILAYYWKKR